MAIFKEQLFGTLILFFIMSSAFIGYLNLSAASGGFPDLGNGQIPGAIAFNQMGLTGASQIIGQDYTNTTGSYSSNVTFTTGTWTQIAGTGFVLSSPALFPPSLINLQNVQSVNNVYTISVTVKNPTNSEFYVYPRYISGNSGSDLKLVFASDGIHLKKFPLLLGVLDNGDDYFLPKSNAQTVIGNTTITTVLNEAISTQNSNTPDYNAKLTVIQDGTTLFSTPCRSILPGYNIQAEVKYAGAGSDVAGFIVMSFPDTLITDTSQTIISGTTGISWLDSAVNAGLNIISAISQFVSLVGTALGFSAGAIFPAWMSIILFGSQGAVLIYLGAQLARGGG